METSAKRAIQWYVVQVRGGQEARMCDVVKAACEEHNKTAGPGKSVRLDECFSPRFKGKKKWKGDWRDVEYPLTPGYVIAATDDPMKLASALSSVSGLCRVMTAGEAYVPLSEDERLWVEQQTHKGDRVVPMSFGYKEGDKLVVTEGPLKGQEGRIVRIDRRNCLAHLEFHVGPMTLKTSVGLGIVTKESSTTE